MGTGDRDGDLKIKSGDPGRGLVNFYAGLIRPHLSLFVPNLKKKEFLGTNFGVKRFFDSCHEYNLQLF